MTLESDVAAIAGRGLFIPASTIEALSGTLTALKDYDGVLASVRAEGSSAVTVSTTEKPTGSTKSLYFNGSNTFVVGRVAPKDIVSTFASSTFSGFVASAPADGTTTGEWASASVPASIGRQYGTAFAATGYTVWGRPGASVQNPKDWTFEGSNDGSSWTTLDTRTGQNPSGTAYTFTNSTTYTYYRLNVSAVQSGGANVGLSRMSIAGEPTKTLFGGTSGERWAVLKGVAGERTGPGRSGTGAAPYYPYSDGKIYTEFGSASRPGFTPAASVTAWHVVNFRKAADGTLSVWINGSSQYSAAQGAAEWAETLTIGGADGGAVQLYAAAWFDSATILGSTDRATVQAYMESIRDGVSGSPVTVAAPVLAGTGTVPAPTVAAGTSVSVAAPVIAGTGALVAPTVSAGTSVNVTTPTLAGTGTLVAPTVDLSASVTVALPTLAGSGDLLDPTVAAGSAVAVAAPILSGSGALVVPTVVTEDTGSVTVEVPVLAGSGALLPPLVEADPVLYPWTSGAHGDALIFLDVPAGVLEVTYPAAVAPATIVEVSLQRASHQMPALTGVRAMDYPIVTGEVGVPHVWVDGVDVTYFRDVPIIPPWREEAPFSWTSSTLRFPQVFHYEERGVGDLAWMRADAPVEVAIVKPDGSRIHKFTGQMTSEDPGVGRGRTECAWGIEGVLWQSEHAHHPVPARLAPTDIRTLIVGELMGTPSRRFTVSGPATGIMSRQRGSNNMSRWGYTSDQLSTAVREDGKQWTLQPTGKASFALALKDTTTVHWTVTAGAPGVELDLSADHHERIDAVYASGVGPDGYAWWNNFFPDLLPYDPPDYPYANPAQNVVLGSTDAGTLTGTGVSDWQRRIRDLGYTTLAVDGVMNSADIAAVRWIQRKRGIQVDGFLGPQTWAATWNVGAVGGDLTVVRLPMAVRPEVEKYLYGANGAVVGLNPDYDPSIIRHEIDVDFGAGVTKAQGREMALRILERGMDPGVAGTIKLTTCPWEGSRWEVNAGDNLLLKGFRGEDILMRVAALDADPESLTVSLTVDSEFRDAMAVMQVLERNRESKADPARRPGNPNKRSRLDQDMVTPFEGESPAGRLPKMALYGGLWTVWPVPVSEIGEVAKLRFRTSGPASKFCLAIFGRPITANQLDSIVPAPLTDSTPWQDREEYLLDTFGWIDTWGKDGQAAGYSPGQEGDGSLTGKLTDDAGFPYVSLVAPWVWVAMWSPLSTFIEGRIYPSPVQ